MEEIYTETIKSEFLNSWNTGIIRLETSKTIGSLIGRSMYLNKLANGELILDAENSLASKEYYFKQGRVEQLRWWVFSGEYPQYKLSDPVFAVYLLQTSVAIFLSDHVTFFKDFLTSVYQLKNDFTPEPGKTLALAFQSFLREDITLGKTIFERKFKTPDKYKSSFSYLLAGLLYQEPSYIELALKHNRKIYEKQDALSMFRGYSEYSTYIAKLAMYYGFKPDISDSIINKAMLKTEKVDYQDIDDVYNAFDIEPIKRYG